MTVEIIAGDGDELEIGIGGCHLGHALHSAGEDAQMLRVQKRHVALLVDDLRVVLQRIGHSCRQGDAIGAAARLAGDERLAAAALDRFDDISAVAGDPDRPDIGFHGSPPAMDNERIAADLLQAACWAAARS